MTISRGDAAGALREVEQVQARSAERRGYRIAGPYLIGWGVIWAIGYSLMAMRPPTDWGAIWLPLDLLGVAGSLLLARRDARNRTSVSARSRTWKSLAASLFIALFVVGTYAVFAPQTVAPAIVYPGLVAGMIYGGIGIMVMPRLAVIGLAMFALSLFGFFFLQSALLYWMAAVGGGGLIVGGLWLRNA